MQNNPWLVALAFAGGLLLGGMCIGAGAMLFNASNSLNPREREQQQMELERMRALEAEARARAEQARAQAEQTAERFRADVLKLRDSVRQAEQEKADAEAALRRVEQERDAALTRLKELQKK